MVNDILKVFIYSEEAPLIFSSGFFWILFSGALLGYSLFYRKPVLRSGYLLLVSIYFYYLAGGWFFLMLIFSTVVDYFLGLGIHGAKTRQRAKLLLIISIAINLLVLIYFKYSYFIVEIIGSPGGSDPNVVNVFAHLLNSTAGTGFDIHTIILPVGVSFYTFQTISYTVDVYRRKVIPVRSIIDFGFYVSFFPQLVAGPIVRAADFIPQLYQKYSLTQKQFWHAVFLILGGLMKKILIADYLAIGLIDRVFESPLNYSGVENILAIYAYSIQIYFDFSGYTDIAIGVALILGFRLPTNFNSPYKAGSLKDFWRRWHISLSSWLRDYLYIPLGGNRRGKVRTFFNLIITMLLGGLWHGAHLRFVLWGLYHGIVLTLEKLVSRRFGSYSMNSGTRLIFSRLLTFHIVALGWLIFRAETPGTAIDMISRGFAGFSITGLIDYAAANYVIIVLLLISFCIISLPSKFFEAARGWFITCPNWVKIILVSLVIILIYQFQISELKPFIYFRF